MVPVFLCNSLKRSSYANHSQVFRSQGCLYCVRHDYIFLNTQAKENYEYRIVVT